MSIQRTAKLALRALKELYHTIDLSSQQQSFMPMNDNENIFHALYSLSRLINHITETGMCDYKSMKNTSLECKPNGQNRSKKMIGPCFDQYDESTMMDSLTIRPSVKQAEQSYGECIVYHPIRIIATGADRPTVIYERDLKKNAKPYRKGHAHSKSELYIDNKSKKERTRDYS